MRRHDPDKSCTLDVEGPRAEALVDKALERAARFLNEPVDNLRASTIGRAYVVEYSKYRPHLGVSPLPLRWGASITVRLRQEVIDERRPPGAQKSSGRGHLSAVPPSPDED